jgi:hypothetical protein
MPPLFACFPVCMTFVALVIVGAAVVVFGMSTAAPNPDRPAPPDDPSRSGTTGPPPWWTLPLMLLALALLLLLALAWYWPE